MEYIDVQGVTVKPELSVRAGKLKKIADWVDMITIVFLIIKHLCHYETVNAQWI